jgi:hypothetical protein
MVYVSKPVWHIPLLCVQWKTPDDGQRNCPKHVEFHSKNKFEKLVQLVAFIVRNLSRCMVTWTSYHAAWSHELHITLRGHMNVNFTVPLSEDRYTVIAETLWLLHNNFNSRTSLNEEPKCVISFALTCTVSCHVTGTIVWLNDLCYVNVSWTAT